jgi:hypothetical protein
LPCLEKLFPIFLTRARARRFESRKTVPQPPIARARARRFAKSRKLFPSLLTRARARRFESRKTVPQPPITRARTRRFAKSRKLFPSFLSRAKQFAKSRKIRSPASLRELGRKARSLEKTVPQPPTYKSRASVERGREGAAAPVRREGQRSAHLRAFPSHP